MLPLALVYLRHVIAVLWSALRLLGRIVFRVLQILAAVAAILVCLIHLKTVIENPKPFAPPSIEIRAKALNV